MGPRTFTGAFAPFHSRFWDWYWPLVRAQQQNASLSLVSAYLTYLLLLGRGMGKSSTVEWAVIAAGALVKEAVVLYVSSTSALAVTHLNSIRERIEGAHLSKAYPALGNPRVGKHGNQYGWRSDMLATDSGLTVFAVGLEQEVRGLRVGDLRPTLIVFDDVDGKSDSPDVVKKKEIIISGTILPAGTANTINLFAQNLIHANSVATRAYKRHSELLSHRIESGMVKAFSDDVKIEQEGTRHVIVAGTPNWKYFDMAACQKFLDDSGPTQWFAEYQHDFETNKEGKVVKHYDDKVHVITRSEFERIFRTRTIPRQWGKYGFNDWAKTKSQYHANVAGMVTVSAQNSPLPGRIFLYNLMSFPAGTEADDVAIRFLKALSPTVPVNGRLVSWDSLIESELKRANLERFATSTTQLLEARRDVLARVIPQHVLPMLQAQNFAKLRMSHEALSARQVYRNVFGLPFEACNPGADGGIELLNHYMRVDHTAPHPFRPEQTGDTRLMVIVEDDEIEFPTDMKPNDLHDAALLRYQFSHWRYIEPKLSAKGIVEQGPEKMNDDFGNSLQMLFHDNIVKAAELSHDEKIEAATPESHRYDTMLAKSPHEHGLLPEQELSYILSRKAAERKIKDSSTVRYFTEDNDLISN